MLEIKDLSIRYGKESNIIENFSLTVNKGEIVTIAGESGSGKTTVIRAVMGALPSGGKVTGGSIIFDGENLKRNKYFNDFSGLWCGIKPNTESRNPICTLYPPSQQYE